MKKYRLIKKYPNSPEVGTVVSNDKLGQYVKENPLEIFQKEEVEKYPEFWEEVKEKEYTILSFTDGSVIYNLDGAGNYTYIGLREAKSFSLNLALEIDKFKIHSVRRESDGEVFTLGDYICLPSHEEDVKKIEKFEQVEGFVSEMAIDVGGKHKWGMTYVKKAPIRKPILITEDGVEIFEGDNYLLFSVWTEGGSWPERRYQIEQVENVGDKWKHFHTKEAREEYIKWNKPRYSLNQIKFALSGNTVDIDLILIQQIERK